MASRDKKELNFLKTNEKKQNGIVYTPKPLADFLSEKLFKVLKKDKKSYRILDPACGEGDLLEAIARYAKAKGIIVELFGFDTDNRALLVADNRLQKYGYKFQLNNSDFLEFCLNNIDFSVDGVIANPPYVRTQALGDEVSKKLARNFHLSGKIDLYQVFYAALPSVLNENGGISVITSNKFLTNKTGGVLRKLLIENFYIDFLVDLGDTKLFDAAVLPAVIVGEKDSKVRQPIINFYKIYESNDDKREEKVEKLNDIYSVIKFERTGYFNIENQKYHATKGRINIPENFKDVWALATDEEYKWALNMKACFGSTISSFGKVRVGIKTTADNVFIRNTWETVEPHPDNELIHPLYSAKKSRRWFIDTINVEKLDKILYPMQAGNGRRKAEPIKLENYPKTKAYLEANYEQLSKRSYVIKAGREWFEIWVPQDPKLWSQAKIIFPDISEEPKFMIDLDGMYVDGNCYWITLNEGVPVDYLYLIVGVANSRAMQRFHSIMFQNKLYSNKFRFISQYVEKYPMPNLNRKEAKNIVRIVKALLNCKLTQMEAEKQIENEISRILDGDSDRHSTGQQSLF